MIKILDSGNYKLVETKKNVKALMLDDKSVFLWRNTGCNGNLEYIKLDPNQICCLFSANNYRLYDVVNEPDLKNGIHLELYAGKRRWQAYLLTKGLPTVKTKKKPITNIDEVISKVKKRGESNIYTASSFVG